MGSVQSLDCWQRRTFSVPMHVVPSVVGHAALASHAAATPLLVHCGGIPPVRTIVPQHTGVVLPQPAGLTHARPASIGAPLLDPEPDPELDVEPELEVEPELDVDPELDPAPLLLPELDVDPPLLLPLPELEVEPPLLLPEPEPDALEPELDPEPESSPPELVPPSPTVLLAPLQASATTRRAAARDGMMKEETAFIIPP